MAIGRLGTGFGRMGASNVAGVGGGPPPFSPLDLGPSLWIDPSDTSTMFQSNAGVTTVTDGSVCGYAGDKSGNSRNFLSLANDGTRPTWNNNAGLPYLDFDGTDDFLRFNSDPGFYAAGACSVFFAVRGNPGANKYLFGQEESTGESFYALMRSAGAASSGQVFIRNHALTLLSNATLQTGAFDNTDNVYGMTDSGSNLTPYLDGVAGTPSGYTRSGVVTLGAVGFCAQYDTNPFNWFVARVYGLVVVNRVLTAPEIVSLTTYLGAKMGVVL